VPAANAAAVKGSLVALFALTIAGCHHDADSKKASPGRSWTTPPLETADGGLAAQKLPRVIYRGGPFLRNPQIITVTFKRDDSGQVARLEQFDDTITRTPWWRTVVDSYCAKPDDCIGEGNPGPHVKLDDVLPADVRDVDVTNIVEREAKAAHLGSLGPNSLIMVYLPKDVHLSDMNTPRYCAGGPRAFHRALDLGVSPTDHAKTLRIPYAVVPRCSDEAELTGSASHEILESSTNPDPGSRGFAFEGGSFTKAFTTSGLEPVDPCGLITMDNHWTFDSGFTVQRAWSNRAASVGHDPCVPVRDNKPYVALVPMQPAVRLAKEGESATIALEATADRPVPAWSISAFDLLGYQDHDHYIDAAIDKTTIAAGQTATLTVTLRKKNSKEMAIVGLVSSLGVQSHMWPLAVITR
jgi:hypothetical protein